VESTVEDRYQLTGKGEQTRVKIRLTPEDSATLEQIADYYNRNWGAFRHVVRFLSGGQTRARFRLVADEGQWLGEFIRSVRSEDGDLDTRWVAFTPLAAIAFWGRLLSSVHSPRARRRLKPLEIAHREMLIELFGASAAALRSRDPKRLESALATRRMSEQQWMMARLAGNSGEARP
jgi:hypothetical protein